MSFDRRTPSIFFANSCPQTVRTISRAAGFNNSSPMLCDFLALTILQATRYEASVACCRRTTTGLVGTSSLCLFSFCSSFSKKLRCLLTSRLCFASKCRFSLLCLKDSLLKTSAQITHCGLIMPRCYMYVKPSLRYSSLYSLSHNYLIPKINQIEK